MEPKPGDEIYSSFRLLFKRSNYFFLKGGFVVIKISRSITPFWGVGRKQVEFLNNLDNYFLVLLVSERAGWFFSKREINKNIQEELWKLRTSDDNYKINYSSLRFSKNGFAAPEEFLVKAGLVSDSKKDSSQ